MCGTDFTSAKKKRFIKRLSECGSITKSAQYASISRPTPYHHRNPDNPCYDADFKTAWEDALERYVEKLEAEADRRAVEGTDRPVFYKGDECGAIREYSDTLLIFRLKALNPEKYRENQSIEMKGALTVNQGSDLSQYTTEELEAIEAIHATADARRSQD